MQYQQNVKFYSFTLLYFIYFAQGLPKVFNSKKEPKAVYLWLLVLPDALGTVLPAFSFFYKLQWMFVSVIKGYFFINILPSFMYCNIMSVIILTQLQFDFWIKESLYENTYRNSVFQM